MLKDVGYRIQKSSLKEREELFCELSKALDDNPDIGEGGVKSLCRLVGPTIVRYNDTKSRYTVLTFLKGLLKQHGSVAAQHLIHVLQDLANTFEKTTQTRGVGIIGLTALTWTVEIGLTLTAADGELVTALIPPQALFLSLVMAADIKNKDSAVKRLGIMWSREHMAGLYVDSLKSLPATAHHILLGNFLLQHSLNQQDNLKDQLKPTLVTWFVDVIISSRSPPPTWASLHCVTLLRSLTHTEFSDTFLPAIVRGLKRNPEICLPSIANVLQHLNIDLSQYSIEIANTLSGCITSKEESISSAALLALAQLSLQCGEGAALAEVTNHLYAVYNGSQGKLNLPQQKCNVIKGIGCISATTAGGHSLTELMGNVADVLVKIIENEAHEGAQMTAVESLTAWCTKFPNSVPKKLLDWFQVYMSGKSSVSQIRTGVMQCVLASIRGNVAAGEHLIPVLTKSVEKALTQTTQTVMIVEGLSAAVVLAKLSVDTSLNDKLATFWKVLLQSATNVFFHDKFLYTASDTSVYSLVELSCSLLHEHAERIPEDWTKILCHVLITTLLNNNTALRGRVRKPIKNLVSGLSGSSICLSLMKEFLSHLDTINIQVGDYGGAGESGAHSGLRPSILVQALNTVTSLEGVREDEVELLMTAAQCGAHQHIYGASPRLWEQMMHKWKLSPAQFITNNHTVIDTAVNQYTNTPTCGNLVSVLSVHCPSIVLPAVLKYFGSAVQKPALRSVTQEEYNILQTPEGVLYDKSVLKNVSEDSSVAKNMKRENKAYSYKEQIEALALQQEIEAKKKKGEKGKEQELTQKQKEALQAAVEREAEVRDRLKLIEAEFVSAVSMLSAVLRGNAGELARYMSLLLPALLPLLNYPVTAQHAANLFIQMRKAVFTRDQDQNGMMIAQVSLRLLSPACKLDTSWQEEDVETAQSRVIEYIYTTTTSSDEDSDIEERAHYSAPTFTYCFPLLRASLHTYTNTDDVMFTKILKICDVHCSMRGTSLYNPSLLPRVELMSLLISVIPSVHGRVQQAASNSLLDVCVAAEGTNGAAHISSKEIDCLLAGMRSNNVYVRDAALRGLSAVISSLPLEMITEQEISLLCRLWVAKFDVSENIRDIAEKVIETSGLSAIPELTTLLVEDIGAEGSDLQTAAADALADVCTEYEDQMDQAVHQLLQLYKDKTQMIPAVVDNFGREIEPAIDIWEPRRGVGMAVTKIAALLPEDLVNKVMDFFVKKGFSDRHGEVKKEMLKAALATVDAHGKNNVGSLLPLFEDFLDKTPKSSSYDSMRHSIIIVMGALARHLDKEDQRVKPIIAKLIEALSTPSQQVQEAVANCLPPLVLAIRDSADSLVTKLLNLLLTSNNYGERRGAAYGIAGMVKGLGILSLKQFNIMSTLTEAIQEKKNYRKREGALFAFELLCVMLGRLFEPYIVHVLPHLLLCFGDSNEYVRQAADDTARAVMSKLSAHGVKLVLPSLLAALSEESWRTKTGSIELLGAMAYCAPKQLSSCLPSIVPKLMEVMGDSHLKVQKAGAQALKVIGSVIRNPEIQAIVPDLLSALSNPINKTADCLRVLLDTQFVHFIDAPSLALIMPVVQRAFQDRSTSTRKSAAQIIGNMYSLTDQKDLNPYLPSIMPGLKTSLLDPVPEVRSVSSRALGAMVRGMGESSFDELLPWLMQTLTSESSAVDRSGAAQGLAEVVGGLGQDKLHKLMPEVISTAERSDLAPHVKDGYIMLFIYLPAVFQQQFTCYIGQIIPPILKALADENEYVRDTALKAGQRIVHMYADTAIAILLPELEKGLFHENWRIRYSSVQLLGDLLYKVVGVSGKMSTETNSEDDTFGSEKSSSAIITALGDECRNRVLSGLYMGRSDVALMVRQAALHVWKVVVPNTPRTLREILPTLFSLLLGCLASTSYDKRQVAARTLGDLVRKLGERVLPEIIPILERGLASSAADQREGVCIGLSEIMASTSKDMVLMFVDSLVPTVKKALSDPLPEVRMAAAKTFDNLHNTVGNRALDDILPALLKQLNDPATEENALDGLRQVMAIKSRVVLPYLVPQLTKAPVNTKALSILASVAGEALSRHLSKILPALLRAVSGTEDKDSQHIELSHCETVVLSVTDESGVRALVNEFVEGCRSTDVGQATSAAHLLAVFCREKRADFTIHIPQLIGGLVHLLINTDTQLLNNAWEALSAITKGLEPSEQMFYVGDLRQAVKFAAADLKGKPLMPGFCMPKGIAPILPIFREAVLNGLPELKESAAIGLGEVILLTSAESLKPTVVHITGPLIRVLGDRFSAGVKSAVLDTLAMLLAKVGVMLKPFLPQLQTTFLKALSDPNRTVRLKASNALAKLIIIHTRTDPLFTELHTNIKTTDDTPVRETMLCALRGVVVMAGDKMSPGLRRPVVDTLRTLLSSSDDVVRRAAAGCLGAIVKWLDDTELDAITTIAYECNNTGLDWVYRHGCSSVLCVALKDSADKLETSKAESRLLSLMAADRTQLVENGLRGVTYLLSHQMKEGHELSTQLIQPYCKLMNHTSMEVKQLLGSAACYLSSSHPGVLPSALLTSLLPTLVNGCKEKNTYVRCGSEIALVHLLKLNQGDQHCKECVGMLEAGPKEALVDLINKALKKAASNLTEAKDVDEFDDTLVN